MKKIEVFKKVLGLLKRFWKEAAIAALLIIAELSFLAAGPFFSKILIDKALPEKNLMLLAVMIFLYFCFMAMQGIINYINTYIYSGINKSFYISLRTSVMQHLQKLSVHFFNSKKSGELLSRVTYDIDNFNQLLIQNLLETLKNFLLIIVLMGLMFYLDYKIALCMMVAIPLFVFLINKSGEKVFTSSQASQEAQESVVGNLHENIAGMKTIKAYNREDFFREKIEQEIAKSEDLKRTAHLRSAGASLTGNILILLATVAIWGIGGLDIIYGRLTVGTFFALLTYFQLLSEPINQLFSSLLMMQSSLSSAKRIFELFDMETDNEEHEALRDIQNAHGEICFKDVSFEYESREETLKNINLVIKPGEIVALIGHSGVGKTSLINLIMKFNNPKTGTLSIGGNDVSKVKGRSLRNQIALVSQDTFIFNASIRDNITMGNPDISLEDLERVTRLLKLDSYIEKLPDGFDTNVGERGLQISGGQRKIIDLCRAFLKKPKILILDEATSELDSLSESIIKDAIIEMSKEMTVIIISHRIATLSWIDKMIVMKDGTIDEVGNHENLMENSDLYRKLYEKFTYENYKKEAMVSASL